MTAPKPLTLVPGLQIGHAEDAVIKTGVTVLLPDRPAVASVHVMGGAPGTRDTDLLAADQTVEAIDALVFSGGSAFGLDAASGVQAWLREQGRGFAVEPFNIPIVPGAILFDLRNDGDKNWGRYPPYRELGYSATCNATTSPGLGTVGAGFGATTATAAGGFGIASQTLSNGAMVTAAVAVNAAGSALIGDTEHFWAAPFEVDDEFGGRGWPARWPDNATDIRTKASFGALENTTLAAIVTDAMLSKAQVKRLAVVAHDGFARALYPVHTPADGDIVFALSVGKVAIAEDDLLELGVVGANTVARAIAVGIYHTQLGVET